MGHKTVSIREYAGDTRGFARRIREDSRRIRGEYASSRGFARVREDSRGFATNTRIRKDYREVNEQIRKDSREVRDGYASSRIEFARIREDSPPVNDSSPSLIRVGTWLGHPYSTYGKFQLAGDG